MPKAKKQSEASIERLGDRVEPNDNTKLPHERDESAGEDSTASATGEGNRQLMRQAQKDIESGKLDTDRGPVTDATYHELRKPRHKR